MENGQSSNKKKVVAAFAVIVVIVLAAKLATSKEPSGTDTSGTTVSSNHAAASDNSGTTKATAGDYKDGTYEATGEYDTPQSVEEITLNVTIKDGVITDTAITSVANERESREFQDQFIAGYKKLVVGKNIDEVRLSRVSGSSLTSKGFNAALAEIKAEAKA